MLELSIAPGRRKVELEVELVRELTAADLELLRGERGIKPVPIKALRDRHHAVARLLAEGRRPMEVSAITGLTVSRISILQDDPTFRELVEFYRRDVNAQYIDAHANMAGLHNDAVTLIRERIEDDPDGVSMSHAIELAKMSADRTGLGPSSTQSVNVNVNLASRLEEARKRVAERQIELKRA